MQNMGYVEELSDEIFVKKSKDEIVLCLGYNGIYGIFITYFCMFYTWNVNRRRTTI